MKRIVLLGAIIPILVWSCDKKEQQELVKDSIKIEKPPYERYGDFVISNIKDEENETCIRLNYCSVHKTISNDIIYREEDNTKVVINSKILGGYKVLYDEELEKVINGEEDVRVELKETIWNDEPHNVLVICSKKTPMVGDYLISDFFDEYGLAYVTIPTAEFYLSKCHANFNSQKMHPEEIFKRLGYNFKK